MIDGHELPQAVTQTGRRGGAGGETRGGDPAEVSAAWALDGRVAAVLGGAVCCVSR